MRHDNKIIIIFFFIFLVFFLLNIPKATSGIKRVYSTVAAPALRLLSSGFGYCNITAKRIFHSNKILQENKILNKEVDALKKELLFYKELEEENYRLNELLNFKKSLESQTIPAKIIGQDLTIWRKSIIINKGSLHDIKMDMPVVASYGLVGRVIEVGRSVSKVMLLTDIEFKISAIIQTGREEGIVEGAGSSECILKYISRDALILTKDIVISSGLGGVFPKGIIIGGVGKVELDANKIFKKIKIKPSVDFSKLEEVLVLISK